MAASMAPPQTDPAKNQAQNSALVGTTCMELALEGERLCKTGDFKNGVKFFEEAIKVGTSDNRTLSAIYSQLGNAYFYLEDYSKALDFHKLDVSLVHSIGDETAEAKACGNLGNTYKMLGKFDEAASYCQRYLEISKKLQDKVGEGRALYNMGNVFHTQGKRMIGSVEQEPGELSADIKTSLNKAIEFYEMNLEVVTNLNDHASMGRAYGNLGNTHYLLGNFEQAVDCHKKRLELARQIQDKSAERRAHLNLGNANVFLGNFPDAIENYSATLKLAQELQDKFTEAHSCYSLANTYTFLRDYKSAINYHLKYLDMIKEFDDKLGEGRACWSLVNLYQMVNEPEPALVYAKRHQEIAEILGDKAGLASAKLNIEELEDIIANKQAAKMSSSNSQNAQQNDSASPSSKNTSGKFRLTSDSRQEQEQRRFKKQLNTNLTVDIDGIATRPRKPKADRGLVKSSSSERLFDMIAHFQSGRIDDQRCEIIKNSNLLRTTPKRPIVSDDKENLNCETDQQGPSSVMGIRNLVARGSQPSIGNPMNAVSAAASAIKATYRKASLAAYPTGTVTSSIQSQRRPTVSARNQEQLFDLIAGAQGQRMDEQRASLPTFNVANGVLRNPTNAGLLNRGRTIDHSGPVAVNPARSTIRSSTIDSSSQNALRSSTHDTVREAEPSSHESEITPRATVPMTPSSSSSVNANSARPRLTRLYQTVDSSTSEPAHDEKFLDSLMKYQSTRFNDQRSEIPQKKDVHRTDDPTRSTGQSDNFFNLIVRFQSDRIDDQRSAPPPTNKKADW